MDSRKLQRTASHVRKEGMGEHPLQWLRADMWADHRRVAPADYNSEMSEAELQHMIKNARETWARAHKDWTPEGDAEFQARRESARSALPSASPASSKKQKTDVSDSPRKQTGFSGSEDDLPRPVPDSPKKSVPSAPKGFGELKDLLSAAAPVGSRRRTQRPGAAS